MKTVKSSALSAAILLSGFASSAAWSAVQRNHRLSVRRARSPALPRVSARIWKRRAAGDRRYQQATPTIGGKAVTFKLQSEDDQSDPRTAVAAAQRLVDSGVAGVVGTGTPAPAFPLRGFTTMRASPGRAGRHRARLYQTGFRHQLPRDGPRR